MHQSYEEYITSNNLADSRRSWIEWKMSCGMEEKDAIEAAYDAEWGYEPLSKT